MPLLRAELSVRDEKGMRSKIILPPFGESLYQRLKRGNQPKNDIFLFFGFHARQHAKEFSTIQCVLALPLGYSPYHYVWPVSGCSILGLDKGGFSILQIEEMAYVLLLSGATAVRVLLSNNNFVVYSRD